MEIKKVEISMKNPETYQIMGGGGGVKTQPNSFYFKIGS